MCYTLIAQEKVRPNDFWSVLFSAGRYSPRSRDLVWEFMQEKWAWLTDRYQGSFLLGRIVEVIGVLYVLVIVWKSSCARYNGTRGGVEIVIQYEVCVSEV